MDGGDGGDGERPFLLDSASVLCIGIEGEVAEKGYIATMSTLACPMDACPLLELTTAVLTLRAAWV